MKKIVTSLSAAAFLSLAASAAFAGMSETYQITVTNTSDSELIAPVLVASTAYDMEIFKDDYVTKEAEVQVLTGDPAMLAARIGEGATVAHGEDGPPGVLLAPDKMLTFKVTTDAPEIRIFAMVAPTVTKDHYLTTTIMLSESGDGMYSANLDRFDIGHDEESMERMMVDATAFGTVTVMKVH
ncbi:MAG: hypothetical protein ACTSU0_02650 [Alphaproteobacteria bacterium]